MDSLTTTHRSMAAARLALLLSFVLSSSTGLLEFCRHGIGLCKLRAAMYGLGACGIHSSFWAFLSSKFKSNLFFTTGLKPYTKS